MSLTGSCARSSATLEMKQVRSSVVGAVVGVGMAVRIYIGVGVDDGVGDGVGVDIGIGVGIENLAIVVSDAQLVIGFLPAGVGCNLGCRRDESS